MKLQTVILEGFWEDEMKLSCPSVNRKRSLMWPDNPFHSLKNTCNIGDLVILKSHDSLGPDQGLCPLPWMDLIFLVWHLHYQTAISSADKAIIQEEQGVGQDHRQDVCNSLALWQNWRGVNTTITASITQHGIIYFSHEVCCTEAVYIYQQPYFEHYNMCK